MPDPAPLRRELRVAFSRRAQPVWFRIVKWLLVLGVVVALWRSRWFWPVMLGAVALSLGAHLLWRWKTKRWTQPWGGWHDVDAAADGK
jgi:hypothetical protein